MNIKKICLVTSVALFFCFVSACGEKTQSLSPKEQAQQDESIRKMTDDVFSIAENLTVINSKHDKKYYVDRLLQYVAECKGANFTPCFTAGFERLKTE